MRGFLLLLLVLLPNALSDRALTKDERLAFIQRAHVWISTDVSKSDIRLGPQGPGAFTPGEAVTCDYVNADLSGTSRKFNCALSAGDIVKVRYGATNGEVQGSVLASRLLWALGFGADRVYPVRVTCRGCSPDPWTRHTRVEGEQLFDPAVIERKPDGREMKTSEGEGWAWPELGLVDEAVGGAPRAHRDALTLLAVFMQHTDSKSKQQRLLCLSGAVPDAAHDAVHDDRMCERPLLMLHDVGLTFGRANFGNKVDTASVNLDEWARTPVWRDAERCVALLNKSFTGTLDNPRIGEAGRAFLAHLLSQLRDEQLHDLFEVARVNERQTASRHSHAPSVDAWVSVFRHKRDEIVNARCPA